MEFQQLARLMTIFAMSGGARRAPLAEVSTDVLDYRMDISTIEAAFHGEWFLA